MPDLQQIELFQVALPTRRKHRWTGLTEDIGTYLIVKVTGSDGSVGWGEAPALKDWSGDYGRYFGESGATVQLVIERYLWPVVRNRPAGDIIGLHAAMNANVGGYPYAKAAIEMAALDLAGKASGIPVWQILGGRARDSVAVTHSIGLIDIDEAVAECRTVAEEGIRTIKLKIGVEPDRDIQLVRRVREAVGDAVELCVDANCGYRTPHQAIQVIRQMEPFGLKYAEQPCEGLDRIGIVADHIDCPVMADESCWNARDALEAAKDARIDILSIYTTKPGGLWPAMEVAAVARAAGLACNVNGSVETGIGNRANLHLALAAPAVELSCVVPVSKPSHELAGRLAGIYYSDDFLASGFDFRDGAIWPDDRPGLGYEVDEDKIKKYRVNTA